ncbi:hydantoinase/oxoprolinase family protein [Desulfosporosinus sp. SYSU MS00001]|uniref:hydantoinase/oxoprolinase family protein n=1 Tax=Desulfosporosinus sp. SYSU MS00001 TaxID=3416284 RepID=UPI003CF98260
MYEIAVDIGGTFADFVARDKQGCALTAKIPSKREDPKETIISGLNDLAQKLGLQLKEFMPQIDKFVHGTTVGVNALLQGQGAKTALITTEGFRDAIELRRSQLSEQWDFGLPLPPVLIPRYLRIGLRERMDYRGVPLISIDQAQIAEIAEFLTQEKIESVAVCLPFACRNPAHEKEFKCLLQALLPDVFISLSSELSSQVGEYERTSTTVLNARLSPLLSNYLLEISNHLRDFGLQVPISIAQNNGGLTDLFQARKKAVSTLFSGPAGGVKGGWALAHELSLSELVVTDMGGTSFDVSLIRRGKMEITPQSEVAGYPLQLPMLDIHTIGAGGGSVAWLDQGGMLRVGPHSAGANPGPACYGLGGAEPTITDAALVMGLIDAHDFLGGRMILDVEQAFKAIETKIASPLGLSVPEAAYAIYKVALSLMIDAVYLMTVKKGYDPRLFSLAAVGGALPLFATALAAGIGINKVVVPEMAPVFCAQGLHYAPFQVEVSSAIFEPLGECVNSNLQQTQRKLKDQADQEMSRLGITQDQRNYVWSADLKYSDQHHEISIELPCDGADFPVWQKLGQEFHAQHQRLYGYCQTEKSLTLVNLKLLVKEIEKIPSVQTERCIILETPNDGMCSVYLNGKFQSLKSYRWKNLKPGMCLKGPAVIKKEYTTVILEHDCQAYIDQFGNLLIYLGRDARNECQSG